jgi:hypothetical protein
MEIQTKTIEIQFEKPLSLDFVKKEIEKMGLKPVRFGITSVQKNIATISISYLN